MVDDYHTKLLQSFISNIDMCERIDFRTSNIPNIVPIVLRIPGIFRTDDISKRGFIMCMSTYIYSINIDQHPVYSVEPKHIYEFEYMNNTTVIHDMANEWQNKIYNSFGQFEDFNDYTTATILLVVFDKDIPNKIVHAMLLDSLKISKWSKRVSLIGKTINYTLSLDIDTVISNSAAVELAEAVVSKLQEYTNKDA